MGEAPIEILEIESCFDSIIELWKIKYIRNLFETKVQAYHFQRWILNASKSCYLSGGVSYKLQSFARNVASISVSRTTLLE